MEENVYIKILLDTLRKKNHILQQLIELSELQEKILKADSPDQDQLEQTFTDKEAKIVQLNQLDDGFEKVYQHVKDSIQSDKLMYKEEIHKMQELIRSITEKNAQLKAMELTNKIYFSQYFSKQKKEIKNFKISNQTANSYYKNVMQQQQEYSHFLDKKN